MRRRHHTRSSGRVARVVHGLLHCALVTSAPVADRRAARKAATRDAIADALLDLLTDGELRPTAREIAQRAGVSLRSVYVHFDDLEDLFCVAAARHYTRIASILAPPAPTGPLGERARAFVEHRAQLYVKVGAVGRATQLQAPFSPTLARIVREVRQHMRREIEHVFAPELDALAEPRRTQMISVLDVLTNGHAWETFRDTYALSADDAVGAIAGAVVTQLEARS